MSVPKQHGYLNDEKPSITFRGAALPERSLPFWPENDGHFDR
jgi:hypothetical protein